MCLSVLHHPNGPGLLGKVRAGAEGLGRSPAGVGPAVCCCLVSSEAMFLVASVLYFYLLFMSKVLVSLFVLRDATIFYVFKDFILFLDREKGREEEKERNVNVWLPLVRP